MAYRYEQNGDIVIDGWENGMADSPYHGIGKIVAANPTDIPGEVSVGLVSQNEVQAALSAVVATFTNLSANISIANGLVTIQKGATVVLTGSPPVNFATATTYYVTSISGTNPTTVTLSASFGGSSIVSGGTTTCNIATIDMGTPMWSVTQTNKTNSTYDPVTPSQWQFYLIDSNGRVWKRPALNANGGAIWYFCNNTTLTNASGNGLAIYRKWLFIFRNNKIDYMVMPDILSENTSGWTYGWKTLNTASGQNNTHYAITANDDTVYYCDGPFIGSFFQVEADPFDPSVFDPSSSITYTWESQALRLPINDAATAICEQGVNLLIGGNLNKLYPWNRVATSFSYPIVMGEGYTQRLLTANNNTYVFAGNRGNVYVTNGSQIQRAFKMPDYILSATLGANQRITFGGVMYHRGRVWFGISGFTVQGATGVWVYDPETKALHNRALLSTVLAYPTVLISTPSDPTNNPNNYGYEYIAGWIGQSGNPGVDATAQGGGAGVPYTNFETLIETDIIPVGTYFNPRSIGNIEFKLALPLVTGESVRISTRSSLTSTWAVLGTWTDTSTPSGFFVSNFQKSQWIQFKIEMSSVSSNASYCRLREIRISKT